MKTTDPCTTGGTKHQWVIEGGRPCPRDGNQSQAVYRCRDCGLQDYGDPSGPGFHDCWDEAEGCKGCFSLYESIELDLEVRALTWNALHEYACSQVQGAIIPTTLSE